MISYHYGSSGFGHTEDATHIHPWLTCRAQMLYIGRSFSVLFTFLHQDNRPDRVKKSDQQLTDPCFENSFCHEID